MRMWTHVLDELIVHALVLSSSANNEGDLFVLVQYDLGVLPDSFVSRFRKECVASLGRSHSSSTTIVLTATHTHTAPDIVPDDEPLIGGKCGADPERVRTNAAYVDYALAQGLDAVRAALGALEPGAFCGTAYAREPGFAFNRRFWMRHDEDARPAKRRRGADAAGEAHEQEALPPVPRRVLTNPPRDAASRCLIGASEGLVDMHVPVAGINDESGRLRVIIPNVALHADTIGGTGISADWPGFLRRQLEASLPGTHCMPLIGCSGNINHFDVDDPSEQSGYEVARAIGEGYASAILDHGLPAPQPVQETQTLVGGWATFLTSPREVSEEEIAKARRHATEYKDAVQERPLTSEDLALGVPAALRFTAENTLRVVESKGRRAFGVASFFASGDGSDGSAGSAGSAGARGGGRGGGGVLLVCLPGEPFTEMGMGLKSEFARGGRAVLVVTHCGANVGYVPNLECFGEGRGGYEVSPMSSPNSVHTSARMRAAARQLVKQLLEESTAAAPREAAS
jgi:hypothetical protein